ncbi:MAG TPA: sensor histidine kinase [Verrucomicrobiae bacterium]
MRFCYSRTWGVFFLAWATVSAVWAESPPHKPSLVLTNAVQVRALSAEEARRQVHIQLRGVLVEKGTAGGFNLVDETAGIYAEAPFAVLSMLRIGDLIEVEGVSDPGRFGPFLRAAKVQRVGHGRVPEPLKPDAESLLSGCMDAQWIEVSGVIREVEPFWQGVRYEMNLDNGGGKILVNTRNKQLIPVDSSVRLRGVCFYLFNNNRQLIRPYLIMPDGEPIKIIRPGTTDLNALPIRPIASLLRFNPNETYAHRVGVRGVVIHSQPGEGFWIHEAGGGTRVYCNGTELPAVGTEVDVFGFLKRGQYGPAIEDAIFRKTGKTQAPAPIQLNQITNAFAHDSDFVECEAQILERWTSQDGCRLKLSDGKTEFAAILRETNQSPIPKDWLPGAEIRVAGICSVDLPTIPNRPGGWDPQSFQILLRSPADITVLQPPPWWNAEHAAWLSAGMAALSLLFVAAVVWISRRRLRAEALARMKTEAEFAAIWNERNRLARELHDTLAQGLSAISMQLEAVKRQLPAETKARELLELARSQVREKLADARDAIWNMRSQVLESSDLAAALNDILKTLTEGTETKGEMCVRGTVRRLAPLVENNLLRIGQEAITNATKYANAQHILVALDFEPVRLQMSISDDGRGFDVNSPPPSESGFGLKGMQERAAEIHAEFSVSSEAGEGTIVTLTLPLSETRPAIPETAHPSNAK